MKKNIYLYLLIIVFAMTAMVGCGGTQQAAKPADKPIVLKLGHSTPPTHPYNLGAEQLAKLVDQKTNGKVKIQVFHSSQLGSERELIEGLQMGTVDMTVISTAPLSGFSSKFLVLDLPFIFTSTEHAYKVLDGPIGTEILSSLNEKGIIGLAFWENGFRNITNSKLPILHPADMKGMKIRTMENPIHMASFSQIGSDPTPMAFGELFTALQQKTVDSQENPLPIIWTSNFHEVQKYLSMTGHFYAAAPLLISKTAWDKLPADAQAALKEAATEAKKFERDQIQKMDKELVAKFKEKGVQVSEVDKKEWVEAMLPVYKQFESKIGTDIITKVQNVK
ncbi:MAG: tripartite ATP-independent periplasmic transporter solute receptor, DctP family [Firmicutes bacterium]|nr:tripartite ATP-independent periplasmic transporter solute receptor, DctP family [Bacillota bacterium]